MDEATFLLASCVFKSTLSFPDISAATQEAAKGNRGGVYLSLTSRYCNINIRFRDDGDVRKISASLQTRNCS